MVSEKIRDYEPVETKSDTNFIEIIKQNIIDVFETGQVSDARQQYAIVEETLFKFIPFLSSSNKKTVYEYFMDQHNLKKNIEVKQKELQKLMDEYGENVKNIYENFIKKL